MCMIIVLNTCTPTSAEGEYIVRLAIARVVSRTHIPPGMHTDVIVSLAVAASEVESGN